MPQLMKDDSIELDLDDRRRVPVAKVFGKDVKRLRATPLPNGSVVLTPVRSYTDDEIAMLLNPERMESIRRGVEQSKAGEVTRYPAGHFHQAYIDTYGVAPEDDEDDPELPSQILSTPIVPTPNTVEQRNVTKLDVGTSFVTITSSTLGQRDVTQSDLGVDSVTIRISREVAQGAADDRITRLGLTEFVQACRAALEGER